MVGKMLRTESLVLARFDGNSPVRCTHRRHVACVLACASVYTRRSPQLLLPMSTSCKRADVVLQVFVTDKRKIKTYGGQEPFGRIRKTLLAEVRAANMFGTAMLE